MLRPGQTVVVSAAPYSRWVAQKVATFPPILDKKGHLSQSWACKHWLEGSKGKPPHSPYRFPWHLIFTVQSIAPSGVTISAEGYRYTLPIDCLRLIDVERLKELDNHSQSEDSVVLIDLPMGECAKIRA